uniref:Serine/threonine-protein kinase CTR1 n=1 Tax=Cajanus cajan TaxID=3821 RepID=A0A151QW62_CAJCA|nr:Serine/threonine-protein kinase CTR1 [Cajanus cajan]
MEQSRLYKQLQYNTMEPRNEEFQSGSQSVIQDHMDGMHAIRRPSDYNTSDVKPVLNYSIQTGEEFALEFMRDRVNLRKPVFSNVGDSNSNYATGSVELKGVLGISHAASETRSDISMLSKVEKGTTEFNRQSTSLHRDRSNYGSIRSIPRSSLNQENSRFVRGYGSSFGSDSSSIMMKCLCSFGGKILPRPSDGKLRYVGGQTRILRLRKDISWQELMQKALLIYNLVHVLKYQLPGEDLDALVSVSSDEDLQNMMEECNLLENRERSQKLRLFLFSMSDLEDAQFALSSIGDDSDVQYVVAVNGMDFGSINSSTPLGVSFSTDDLHELERQTIERETNRVAVESIGISNAPLTNKSDASLTIHSSQTVLPNLSNAYEIDQQSYGDQMMQVADYSHQYFVHHGLSSTHNPGVGGTPIPMAPHLLNNQQGFLNEDHLPSGLQIQNSQLPTMQVRKIDDSSVNQGSDPGKVLSSETASAAPLQPFDSCLKSNFPEAAVVVTMPEGHLPTLPSTKKVQNKDCEEASSTSSSAFVPAYVDSQANAIDLSSLHPPPLPERIYYSERTPREQVELLNRSSKSDDTHSSQIHVSDLLSDVTPEDPVTESSDNLHDDVETENCQIDWGEASGKESNDGCDILIDIDDRFPRELLSDIFSKAILGEDPSSLHPPSGEGVGLSINMENHEPKRWSYFHKLAQGLDNVSLIDQDHLAFSPVIEKAGDNRTHHVTPLTADGVPQHHEDSHLNFSEENQEDLHSRIETETTVLKSNFNQSQLKDEESMQFDVMMENLRTQESEFEDGKFDAKNSNLPALDPSFGDIDISTVQVIKNEDLEELRELGSGTFGTVYHGKWRGTDVAIKRIKKSCFTGRSSEQERLTVEFWREADILSKLHHPNVVAFYGVVQHGPGGTMATVAEYMVDGSLRHVLLRKDRYLDRRKRLIIAMDAAFGMEYLHSKNIVHFDLKCDNLLVNLKDPLRPICKVGDFGLSKIKRNTLVTGGVRGTLPWMAPELLNGSSNKVSEKVDVFSFGIVLWEILTGEEPYANMHYGAIIGGIVNNTLRPTIPSNCDPEWRTLMEQCWAPNPAARPSFTEIASRLRIMSAAASQTKTQGHKPSK